jgi:hypothetical protein
LTVHSASEKQLLCDDILEEELVKDAENYENFL